jgi:prolycopene isomerase
MRRYFKNDAIKKIFATEEMLISVLVQIGWAYQGDFQAPPEGGSVEFARWLVGRIEAAGSRVVLGRRVGRVLVESGGVRGVALEAPPKRADRQEHEIACRHVVASCDVLSLYEKLLPPGTADPKHLDRLRRMDLYNSSVTLSLGIDCPVEEIGFGEEMWIVTRDDVPRAEQNCVDPERCAITILAPSFRDPSMAPPGKGTLALYTEAQIGYGNRWQTGPGYERGPDYRAFKEAYAQTILDRVEKSLGVELRRHIEEMAVATPITHWRYTGNHSGSIMGERPSRWNIRNGVAQYRTPVDRLFLGGQWAEYGGGVPIATRAGANASVLVLRETRQEAYEALCAAMLPG